MGANSDPVLWIRKGENVSVSVGSYVSELFTNLTAVYLSGSGEASKLANEESKSAPNSYSFSLEWIRATDNKTMVSCFSGYCALSFYGFDKDQEGSYELWLVQSQIAHLVDAAVIRLAILMSRATLRLSGKFHYTACPLKT